MNQADSQNRFSLLYLILFLWRNEEVIKGKDDQSVANFTYMPIFHTINGILLYHFSIVNAVFAIASVFGPLIGVSVKIIPGQSP